MIMNFDKSRHCNKWTLVSFYQTTQKKLPSTDRRFYDEQQIMNGFIFNLSWIQSEAKLLFLRETIKSVLAINDNIHVRAQIFNFWLNFASLKET